MAFVLAEKLHSKKDRIFHLSLDRTTSIVACVFLAIFCLERLYMPGRTSGSFNSLIYGSSFVLAFSVLAFNARKVSYGLKDFCFVAAVFYFLLWAYDSHAVQYAVIVMVVMLAGKLVIDDMLDFHRTLVVLGLVFSCIYCIGEERWSGFLNNSAPVFSLIMIISMAYLLFHPKAKHVDILLSLVALFLIFMTETRITLLVALVLVVARFFSETSKRVAAYFARHKFMLVIVLTIIFIFVFSNYELLLSIISRSNGDASSATRIGLMQGVCSQWLQNGGTFFFGNKGGFAMQYVALLDPTVSGNMPVHQDILMLLCDYGIIGFGLFCFAFSSFAAKWPWYALLILAMATFHNVFTAGVAFLLLILSFNSLANAIEEGRTNNA